MIRISADTRKPRVPCDQGTAWNRSLFSSCKEKDILASSVVSESTCLLAPSGIWTLARQGRWSASRLHPSSSTFLWGGGHLERWLWQQQQRHNDNGRMTQPRGLKHLILFPTAPSSPRTIYCQRSPLPSGLPTSHGSQWSGVCIKPPVFVWTQRPMRRFVVAGNLELPSSHGAQ